MRRINLRLPRNYSYRMIEPKISVDINGRNVTATIVRSSFSSDGMHLVVDIPKEVDADEFIELFSKDGAIAYEKTLLTVDKEECIECGQCTAMCAYGALDLDPEDFSLVVQPGNCTGCRTCIDACPRRCITVL